MSTMTTTTGYEVAREPALEPVRDDLVALINATRSRTVDGRRFDWLYEENPDGPAVIWSLRKADTGEMVGFTACLPRRMLVEGVERRAWVGADFSMLPHSRTLGPALKLRRAAKEAIDAGEVDFLYSHPNDRMASIHQRVGHQRIGLMQRYARVLRTESLVAERLKSPMLGQIGGAVLDPFLRLADPEKRTQRECCIERHPSCRFDARFDVLFAERAPKNGVFGVRDALYLNWRYGTNPLYESHVITALRDDRLAGYLVFNIESDSLYIRDVFPADDPAVARDLLAEATRWGRELRLRSATFTVFQGNSILPVLEQFGYRPRAEQSQMFAYAGPQLHSSGVLAQADNWQITVGDRDV
ncbi:MAG: hypothetical protein KF861_21800 [Planctomycetaceae bacterium]|nr:hypothetical protein [Planctomycetaceae bacterium]